MVSCDRIMNVSVADRDIICQSKAEVTEIIRSCAASLQGGEIWMSSEDGPYPCLSILIKGEYACCHYFKNDEGEVWQSCGDLNEEVVFLADGGEWNAPEYVIISLEKAIDCMEGFWDTLERPKCVEWDALWEDG